jgi:uncharacterized protein YecE (DUF72 family)
MQRSRTAPLRIGTAGWAIPKAAVEGFPVRGSHLTRYASRLDAVEINSTFYRLPRRATVERWRDVTPAGFRFAVKMPSRITHECGLCNVRRELREFVELCSAFGEKLGPLLIQLPPSLEFERRSARAFLERLRSLHHGPIVWEPRHPSWFSRGAEDLLLRHESGRLATDPARVPAAALPGAANELVYYRLHGSPRMYYSAYEPEYLDALAADLRGATLARSTREVWCIFDNTALGAAAVNALELRARCAAKLHGYAQQRNPSVVVARLRRRTKS